MGTGMSHTPSPNDDRPEAGRYEIRVSGHLHERWAAWFDGLAITHGDDGTTVIAGQIADQAALHGVLQRVRDLGMPLVSVTEVDANNHHHRLENGENR